MTDTSGQGGNVRRPGPNHRGMDKALRAADALQGQVPVPAKVRRAESLVATAQRLFNGQLPPLPIQRLPLPRWGRRFLRRLSQAGQVRRGQWQTLLPAPARRVVATIALLMQLAGGFLVGSVLVRPNPSTVVRTVPASYEENVACTTCPGGFRFMGLEVQQRGANTLFVVRGTWPATVPSIPADVRLAAGPVLVVLHPDQRGFLVTTATRNGASIDPTSVGTGLRAGVVLISLPSALVSPPFLVEVGLWKAGAYLARLPSSGQLLWDGQGAPHPPGVPPATTTSSTALTVVTAPSTVTSTPIGEQIRSAITTLAAACPTLPFGTEAPALRVARVGSGVEADPRTKVPTPWVGGGFTVAIGTDVHKLAPFSFTAVLLPPGAAAPASGSPIDRAGTIQLWIRWDGGAYHKGIRRWDGQSWTMRVDSEVDDMTILVQPTGAAFYWAGLQSGWRYGFITADANGCVQTALRADLTPIEVR